MDRVWRLVRLLILGIFLGCCLWIARNVPYAHDDLDWGLPMGLDWWLTGAMNNRYAGSFFAVCMTRSQAFKTAVMGGTMFLLPVLAALAALPRGRRANWFPLTVLAGGVLLAAPAISWRQTYGWVSSFANYVVSGIWVFLLVILTRRGVEGRRAFPAVLFPLALTAQLFVENLTVLIAAAALGLAAWSAKTGRGRPAALSLLAGALLGLGLMFNNPLYSDLAAGGAALDGIRALTFEPGAGAREILSVLFRRFFGLILPSLFECWPAVWVLVCAGALGQAYRQWSLTASRRTVLAVLLPCGLFCAGYLWSAWLAAQAQYQDSGWVCPWGIFRSAGAAVVLLIIALCVGKSWPRLALLAGALFLAAPFAVVSVDGPRCYFHSALLLLLLGLSLADAFPWNAAGTAAAVLLLGAALAFHLHVYRVLGGCEALRLRLLREAVEQGRTSVVLPREGRRYLYVWGHNPQSAERAERYRSFYSLPAELELIFLPPGSYDVWPNITQEMMDNATVY